MKRLFAVATLFVLVALLFVPVSLAAGQTLPHTGRVLISTNGDLTVPAGDHADAVIVVDGTARIQGEVNTLIVVQGAAFLDGARTETIFAVNSPVTLGQGTVVLGDVMKVDSLITKTGSADVQGAIRDLPTEAAGLGLFLGPLFFLLFAGFAVAAIAAGLLLAALAARQVRAAEALISHEPVTTFLVGVGGVFLPMILIVVLFVTVIGAPLAFGILFALWPLTAFLGYLVSGILIGDWILGRTSPGVTRERPYLAAVIGLIVLEIIGIWPFFSMIAVLFGYGAVLLLAWRTFRQRPLDEAAASSPGTAALAA